MAGLGYKDFIDGEILSAAQVDGYLNQQTLMVFASAAARTTALSAVLSEGMVTYLLDTNATEYYTGAAWIAFVDASSVQTLTNKTLTAPTVSGLYLSDGAIVLEGATADPFETTLQITDPTADRTITLPNATGTVMLQDAAVNAGTVATAANAGYMGIPQNSTTTGAYTITAADNGKHIYFSATRTVTIDSNANLALPIGFTWTGIAASGATGTIAITTDTMYLAGPGTTGSRTLAAFGMATWVKTGTTTWFVSGNGLT